jgi:sugar lactone lactonase YvrE
MGNATLQNSYLDDVRFNPASGKAYLTDVSSAAIIVLDLDSGHAIRVLENDVSTLARNPRSADGNLIRHSTGGLLYTPSDQLEVSPDGKWFYFQAASGGMSRIQTEYLDEAFHNSSMVGYLPQLVEYYALTPSSTGTAIDAQGNIYLADVDRRLIEKIYPNGTRTILIQDERLSYVDAMWIDSGNRLWMPAAQLHLAAPFHNGTSLIKKPLEIFTLDIGVGPSPIDHI